MLLQPMAWQLPPSTSDVITGADLSGGMVDIGGISSIAGQANFDLSASSTNVSGKSTAKADSTDATGLVGGVTDKGEPLVSMLLPIQISLVSLSVH